jgi:2,3-bisphosphoglycerate-independent phosphoglycerate mutase
MNETQIVLKNHPLNKNKRDKNIPEANSVWLWGQGKAPSIPKLEKLHGISSTMISAVDLMKGLAVLAGMEVINVEGATGFIDTNYEGKREAAVKALGEKDFVYIHLEAPDESGHQGSVENKVKAIEDFDLKIVGPLMEEIKRLDGRAIVLSDHPTPTELMTHTSDPVPFAVWPPFPDADSANSAPSFDESIIDAEGSLHFTEGHLLFERFIKKV